MRAATRLRMQAKANLGDPVAFQPQVDAATEATFGAALRLDRPAESFTTGPTGGSRRKKLLGVSKLVAIRRSRNSGPADHRGIAALLNHRGEIAVWQRPEA